MQHGAVTVPQEIELVQVIDGNRSPVGIHGSVRHIPAERVQHLEIDQVESVQRDLPRRQLSPDVRTSVSAEDQFNDD